MQKDTAVKRAAAAKTAAQRITALLDKASPAQLKQLAGADIKFVSPLAGNRARQSGKSDYTADRIYGDRRDLRD